MPRPALFALLLSVAAASALQAQSDPPTGPQKPAEQQQPAGEQPARDLQVAPSPGEKTPEATTSSTPGDQVAGVPANVCAELVSFFQQQAAKAAQAEQGSGAKTAGPGQTSPPMDQVQQRSGISAPVPQDATKTGSTVVSMEQAEQLARSNDLRGCQSAVQHMRRAGMALPAGLLALATLRDDLLAKSKPPSAQ